MNTILIIEDEPQIRENIQEILDLQGFATITAEDGLEGLQMAERHQPDIIICDLMMPRLDGYGVIKALRQQPLTADIPLVFLTAKAEHRDLRQAMELGANDYLTKPFEPNELIRVISVQLEKRQIVAQRYSGQIKQMEDQINYLTRHDSLTGLPNQFFLEEYFNQTRLQVYNQSQFLPLLLIDIEILYRTKLFFEPSLKNLLIKTVGEQLNQLNSQDQIIDLIAYLKTDQLALLLKPVQDSKIAANIALQILENLSQPLIINNQEISIQAKIGIACYPNDALQLGELLTHAEVTLEHYKQENKTYYYFYNQEILDIVFRKVILETDFWQALERNEFQLYYQPQMNIQTKKVVGLEALIRWQHPEYGMISPAEFIPMAEESGFIIPLGEWVVKTACSQIKKLQLEGFGNLNVAVNISAYQFRQENFLQRIHDIIIEANFNPELLELELTETVFIQDIEVVKSQIEELRNYGIKLSIDDFGTGYSSFKYLQELSFSHLKIDRYFISNIDKLENKQSIVKSIIQLADSLKINIIAEGVETNEELNWLKHNHCSMIQGYFISRPLTIEELKTFLLANH
ncbi:EAL domain-containing protein [Anabaena sp. UHCC 0253]|uniref:Response regulator n=2 Tax=unclassified Anabaena TaxID=2619674 RepID=A0A0U3AJ00_9NOST|nr:EAL domain-containing protein [Anabaena sp. UHCC 0253]ALT22099.1 response regulator [Anabaena sp. XPORK13A]ALT22117.1 response regulator [Anabaena sp. XSPORK2A]MTJ51842.1 EAL domain-containing protein [Anabaena sp. UHCC 0253]